MAMTAEALYTITTLMHTSSNVAVNSHLSLVSFRAILRGSRPRLKVVADSAEIDGGASSQESSAGREAKTPPPRTRGHPAPPGSFPPPPQPADASPLPARAVPPRREPHGFLLEDAASF